MYFWHPGVETRVIALLDQFCFLLSSLQCPKVSLKKGEGIIQGPNMYFEGRGAKELLVRLGGHSLLVCVSY